MTAVARNNGCGYNCGREMTGAEIDFPHVVEGMGNRDFSLCPRVHVDCLVKDATDKMWTDIALKCPSCQTPGNAHTRISRKQRFWHMVHKHPYRTIAVASTGLGIFAGATTLGFLQLAHWANHQDLAFSGASGFVGGIVGWYGSEQVIEEANIIAENNRRPSLHQPLLQV